MDMVERVARALCGPDADKMVNGIVVTDLGTMGFAASPSGPLEPMWHSYRAKARAAIEAMREPTDAMTAEGGDTPCGQFYPGSQAANIWRNMIDVALTPSPASK